MLNIEKEENLRGVVQMGMVDSKFATDVYVFEINLDEDIVSQIRKERINFLRLWLAHSLARRPPQINIFFEAPNEEWLFVDNIKEGRKNPKTLIIDSESLKCVYLIKKQILEAWEYALELWDKELFSPKVEIEARVLRLPCKFFNLLKKEK